MQTCMQQGKQTVYQRRSGDRLFGAGDHIGLVVDLEGQTGRQTGQGRSERLSVQIIALRAAAVEGKVEHCAQESLSRIASVSESDIK